MALDISPPPVPSRPHSAGSYHHDHLQRPPVEPLPPVPPLPPGFLFHQGDMYHPSTSEPMFATQFHHATHSNVSVTSDLQNELVLMRGPGALDGQRNVLYNGTARFATVPPPPPLPPTNAPPPKIQGYPANHVHPSISSDAIVRGRSAVPPALPSSSSPPLPAGRYHYADPTIDVSSVSSRMAAASLNESVPSHTRSVHGAAEYSQPPLPRPPSSTSETPRLAAPLPTIATLQIALTSVQSPNAKMSSRIAWIRDVLLLVNRACAAEGTYHSLSALPLVSNTLPSGPIKISDTALRQLAESAVLLLLSIMPTLPRKDKELTPPLAEALYIRATLTASGAFPDLITASPRNAFRECEAAAKAGFARAWFRLGRDYESINDSTHARECFQRGMAVGDVACIYRIGMAMLLGQIDFPEKRIEGVERAAQLLHEAAMLATVDFPHPPYVFALFLLGEFSKIIIPAWVLANYVPAGSSMTQEARRHLERSAFLHFAPAQQRIGRAYEFAEPAFPFDPSLSVEYYSLASAGGDAQADLGLSKWYLCGVEGYFDKDETRAREYASRAASRELPAAMFAMGYYCEVGIGAPSDIDRSREWYEKAAAHGEVEAETRLKALADTSVPLSREEHDTLAETRLVRSRTQARMRSNAATSESARSPSNAEPSPEHVVRHVQDRVYQPQPRQSSLLTYIGHSDQYGTPAQTVHNRQHQQSVRHLQHRAHGQSTDFNYVPPPYPNQGPDRWKYAELAPHYSLVDPGVVPPDNSTDSALSTSGARQSASAVAPRPRREHNRQFSGQGVMSSSPLGSPRPVAQGLPFEASPSESAQSRSGTRYNTFEEMGIKTGRAVDKECVIM